MGYVGNQQTEGFSQVPAKQDLTGATGTSLTLTHAVASAEGIDLFINNVRQEPTEAYSVVGTAVTLTGSVVATDDIYVVYNSLALQTTVPPDASVSTAKIIDGSVTMDKLATSGTLPALNGSNLTNVGQVIGISTPTILRGDVSVNAGLTQLGSASLYYVSGTGILTNTYTKKSSTSIITAHWNVNYHQNTSGVGTHGFFCAAGTSGNTDTIIAMPQDFNRIIDDLSVAKTFSFSGSGPFVGLAAGSYDFIMGPVRGSDPGGTTGFRWNYREHGDQPANSLQTSYLYVTETEV